MSPRFTSGMPKRAVSAATTRSHESTISNPPASAGPFTAAMIGFGKSRVTMPAKPPLPRAMSLARPCATTFRSAPAENTSPAPVSTTARKRGVGLDLVEEAGHRLADFGADRVARLGPVQA